MEIDKMFYVNPISFDDCKEWILYKHYAHRIPPIMYAFGLFKGGILQGICTFGAQSHILLSKMPFKGIIKIVF